MDQTDQRFCLFTRTKSKLIFGKTYGMAKACDTAKSKPPVQIQHGKFSIKIYTGPDLDAFFQGIGMKINKSGGNFE
jgi:hypothetical protein